MATEKVCALLMLAGSATALVVSPQSTITCGTRSRAAAVHMASVGLAAKPVADQSAAEISQTEDLVANANALSLPARAHPSGDAVQRAFWIHGVFGNDPGSGRLCLCRRRLTHRGLADHCHLGLLRRRLQRSWRHRHGRVGRVRRRDDGARRLARPNLPLRRGPPRRTHPDVVWVHGPRQIHPARAAPRHARLREWPRGGDDAGAADPLPRAARRGAAQPAVPHHDRPHGAHDGLVSSPRLTKRAPSLVVVGAATALTSALKLPATRWSTSRAPRPSRAASPSCPPWSPRSAPSRATRSRLSVWSRPTRRRWRRSGSSSRS